MSIKLLNHVKSLPGFTPAEKSVLKELADLSRDDQTIFVSLDKLSLNTSYSVRSLQYTLRRLEQKQAIISQNGNPGRGHVHAYRFNVGYLNPVESAPVVPPEHIPPPTNGHAPQAPAPPDVFVPDEESPRKPLRPLRPLRPPRDESVFDDPLARRDGESLTHWAMRVDKLKR